MNLHCNSFIQCNHFIISRLSIKKRFISVKDSWSDMHLCKLCPYFMLHACLNIAYNVLKSMLFAFTCFYSKFSVNGTKMIVPEMASGNKESYIAKKKRIPPYPVAATDRQQRSAVLLTGLLPAFAAGHKGFVLRSRGRMQDCTYWHNECRGGCAPARMEHACGSF